MDENNAIVVVVIRDENNVVIAIVIGDENNIVVVVIGDENNVIAVVKMKKTRVREINGGHILLDGMKKDVGWFI